MPTCMRCDPSSEVGSVDNMVKSDDNMVRSRNAGRMSEDPAPLVGRVRSAILLKEGY
jgi:hypothetical protein